MGRFKSSHTPTRKSVAFRTFGEIRPLHGRYVLPVYYADSAPPMEIVCDSMEAALAGKRRLHEADMAEFERSG